MLETELTYPDYGDMCFRAKCELREEYIKWQIIELKQKHQRAIENQAWEFILVVESKIHLTEVLEYPKLKMIK